MQRFFPFGRFLGFLVLVVVCARTAGLAQSNSTSRITRPIDDRVRTTLKGNVHPLAQSRYDRGAVADSFPAERMLLMLRRSPGRQAVLRQFLQERPYPGQPQLSPMAEA